MEPARAVAVSNEDKLKSDTIDSEFKLNLAEFMHELVLFEGHMINGKKVFRQVLSIDVGRNKYKGLDQEKPTTTDCEIIDALLKKFVN